MNSLEQLAKAAGYKYKNKAEAIAANCCIKCGNDVDNRISTQAGTREYLISGICEVCFDSIFQDHGD